MKNKTLIKTLLLVMLCFVILGSFSTVSAVMSVSGTYKGTVTATDAQNSITTITSTVLTAIRYAGSGIALIMLTVIFIKYMLSAASERAEIKKNLIPFTIGAIVLFAASNLVTVLQKVTDKVVPAGS